MRAPRPISPIPARFVSLPGAPGDKTPDHPRRYRLHRFTTIHPRTIIPRYDPSFYHYVHATSPFLFFAACACRTTFDEPPLRLHRCLLPRLCSSSMDFLSFFSPFVLFLPVSGFIVVCFAIRFFFFWMLEEDILYVECHRLCSMDLL